MEMIMQYLIIDKEHGTECARTNSHDAAECIAHALTDSSEVGGEWTVKEVQKPLSQEPLKDNTGVPKYQYRNLPTTE